MVQLNRGYRETKAQQFTKSKLEPIKNPKQSTYEVTLVHMHGDADNYTTDVIDFDTEAEMLDFANFILRCMVAYPHGKGGDQGFDHVDGFDKYEDYFHVDNEMCGGHADPDSMNIVYYDADSVKWDVKLTN